MKEKMYSVAIRKKESNEDFFWLNNDYEFVECKIDTCGGRYWFADPFIFEIEGKTYLFFEAFDLKEQKGKIGYTIYEENGRCTPIKIIINEPYHLSFPNIFEYKGGIYIMPECCGDYTVKVFRAKLFPDEWEPADVLLPDVYACDTIFMEKKDKRYLLTSEMFHNVPNGQYASCWVKNRLYNLNGLNVVDDGKTVAVGDNGIRNAGKSFLYNDELYRIGQDCRDRKYGRGLVLFKITSLQPYSEEKIWSLEYDDISKHLLSEHIGNVIGTHTYNSSNNYEIVDFSYMNDVPLRIRLKRKAYFCKKVCKFIQKRLSEM